MRKILLACVTYRGKLSIINALIILVIFHVYVRLGYGPTIKISICLTTVFLLNLICIPLSYLVKTTLMTHVLLCLINSNLIHLRSLMIWQSLQIWLILEIHHLVFVLLKLIRHYLPTSFTLEWHLLLWLLILGLILLIIWATSAVVKMHHVVIIYLNTHIWCTILRVLSMFRYILIHLGIMAHWWFRSLHLDWLDILSLYPILIAMMSLAELNFSIVC